MAHRIEAHERESQGQQHQKYVHRLAKNPHLRGGLARQKIVAGFEVEPADIAVNRQVRGDDRDPAQLYDKQRHEYVVHGIFVFDRNRQQRHAVTGGEKQDHKAHQPAGALEHMPQEGMPARRLVRGPALQGRVQGQAHGRNCDKERQSL